MTTQVDRRLLVAGFVVGVSLASVALAIILVSYLPQAGWHIDSPDIVLDYIKGLLWAVAVILVIAVLPVNAGERNALLLLWGAKVVVTLGIMLPYESFYCFDACGYYAEGRSLNGLIPVRFDGWEELGFGHGTENMVLLAGWHNLLIADSYHAMKVTWAFLGLLGVFFFYRASSLYLGYRDLRVLYLLGLFPSILFWGSILGKDPITLLGISLYALGIVGWWRGGGSRSILLAALGITLTALMRIWLVSILIFPLFVFVLRGGSLLRRIAIATAFVVGMSLSSSLFIEQFAIQSLAELIERTDALSQGWSQDGGAGQEISGGLGSLDRILMFAPLGAFTALFRPLPGEVLNAFGVFASLENLFLLGLFAVAFWRGHWRRRLLRDPVLLWAATEVVLWAVVYGYVSYQNLGTAVRYKLQILPMLVLLLIELARPTRLRRIESKTLKTEGAKS
jgi:hypothetical protein